MNIFTSEASISNLKLFRNKNKKHCIRKMILIAMLGVYNFIILNYGNILLIYLLYYIILFYNSQRISIIFVSIFLRSR